MPELHLFKFTVDSNQNCTYSLILLGASNTDNSIIHICTHSDDVKSPVGLKGSPRSPFITLGATTSCSRHRDVKLHVQEENGVDHVKIHDIGVERALSGCQFNLLLDTECSTSFD